MLSTVVEKLFAELFASDSEDVRWPAANFEFLPLQFLPIVATDSYDATRVFAASHPDTPPQVLRSLASDSQSRVRAHVAANPSTPPQALDALSSSVDEYVLSWVGLNPHCSSVVFDRLFKRAKKDFSIARSLLSNRSCPTNMVDVLLDVWGAPAAEVAALAGTVSDEQLAVWADNRSAAFEPVQVAVASYERCPVFVLKVLADSSRTRVRAAVARNPSCPPELFSKLMSDQNLDVLAAVAGSVQCPTEVIDELIKSGDREIYLAAAVNPNLSDSADKMFLVSDDRDVRAALAKNSGLTDNVLLALTSDEFSVIRRRLAYRVCSSSSLSQGRVRWVFASGVNEYGRVPLLCSLAYTTDLLVASAASSELFLHCKALLAGLLGLVSSDLKPEFLLFAEVVTVGSVHAGLSTGLFSTAERIALQKRFADLGFDVDMFLTTPGSKVSLPVRFASSSSSNIVIR